MIPFADRYDTAVEKNTEAQKEGESTRVPVPKPERLESNEMTLWQWLKVRKSYLDEPVAAVPQGRNA